VRFTRIVGSRVGIRRVLRKDGEARLGLVPDLIPDESPERGPAARPDGRHVKPTSYFLVSLLFSGLVFGFFLVSEKGLLQVRRQRQQLVRIQAEVAALDAENRKLEAEVAALKTDPRAAEKVAREKLNLVRPGEIVVMLPAGWKTRVKPPAPETPPVRSP
jgi:cell division protein FtsB